MSDTLARLAAVIESRRRADPDRSYVARLFAKGEDAILKKIGEEATEVVLAAKGGERERIVHEVADLWFHSMIALSAHGLKPADVLAELERREGQSGLEEFALRKAQSRDEGRMNQVTGEAAARTPEELALLKNVTMVVYALQALAFLWGITAVVGVVINYVKRDDARGTVYESHFDWQIRTFWWGILWGVIGIVLTFAFVGVFVLFAAWVWMIYRVVKGFLKLNEGQPVLPA